MNVYCYVFVNSFPIYPLSYLIYYFNDLLNLCIPPPMYGCLEEIALDR